MLHLLWRLQVSGQELQPVRTVLVSTQTRTSMVLIAFMAHPASSMRFWELGEVSSLVRNRFGELTPLIAAVCDWSIRIADVG
jgi:hypothetical protein